LKSRLVLPIILLVSLLLPVAVFADEPTVYEIEPVIVTGSRVPSPFSKVGRTFEIIDREEIEAIPASSVEELLDYIGGVDVRSRGEKGVQADVSIRGASFEQTQIMIDGVKVSDPQSGHHNMDLPLDLNTIDRIEILKGGSSSLYGPNAVGGVVNIITKRPTHKSIQYEFSAGENALTESNLNSSYIHGQNSHYLSYTRRRSDGYIQDTDFDIQSITYRGAFNPEIGEISFTAGYTEKKFGAYKFYSDIYPNEWEATKTIYFSMQSDAQVGHLRIIPRMHWRRHNDEFILDRDNPDWFHNKHATTVIGGEIQASMKTGYGTSVLGYEAAKEEIESESLGDHYRTRRGLFAEQRMTPLKNLTISLNASAHVYDGWGWQFCPSFNMAYKIAVNGRLRFSVGRSFRVPTFTELYYESPANMGNMDLEPEKTWSYEIGADYKNHYFTTAGAVFLRDGKDMIDWAKDSLEAPWRVMNVANTETYGVELEGSVNVSRIIRQTAVQSIGLYYGYTDAHRTTGNYESKYLLDFMRHQMNASVNIKWTELLSQSFYFRYARRRSQPTGYHTIDTRWTLTHGAYRLYFEAANMFNKSYSEIGTIPGPGRWFRAGFSVTYR